MIIYYYLMIWSQEGCLHQLLMISLASVNLIEVHWSHGALALDCWIAMTCVWSPSVEIQSFIALQIQLGFGESIRVLVNCLTECELMAYSQLSHNHSFISNCLVTSTTIFFFFFTQCFPIKRQLIPYIQTYKTIIVFQCSSSSYLLSVYVYSLLNYSWHTHIHTNP